MADPKQDSFGQDESKAEVLNMENENPEELPEQDQEMSILAPKPKDDCFVGCDRANDPCCLPILDHHDPKYLSQPARLAPECKADAVRPVQRFEEKTRKRAMVADRLTQEAEFQKATGGVNCFKKTEVKSATKDFYDKHPETTRSTEFLRKHPEFQIAGPNPRRVPHDELIQAMNGFTNMQLAHEICINHDFRLERYTPVDDSLESRVREMMMKAYWDTFDEALSAKKPNHKHALSVFREMKAILLKLLMPHNHGMRRRIEEFLNEEIILMEIKHHTIDVKKYSDFVVETLGMLCCPVRDKEILAIKTLEKPSDLFKAILEVMEKMQLDMANFLISQIRPSVITNCVEYERHKFADFIDIEYRLNEDALRVTRSWILRHRIQDRAPSMIVARAFAETLLWKEDEWPETLTLDWTRFMKLAEETNRVCYVGAVAHATYSVARAVFHEDDAHLSLIERANPQLLHCYSIRDKLRADANILLTKEDVFDETKLKNVLQLVAEQAVKVVSDCMIKELEGRILLEPEKEIIRRTVLDVGSENHKVRLLLLRRIQEYLTDLISTGSALQVEFPKALLCIQNDVLKVCVEFHRIAMHNRAVFQDLYTHIIQGHCHKPRYMTDHHRTYDHHVQKTIDVLRGPASRKLKLTRPAENEKLESFLDPHGKFKVEAEDMPVIETNPEIEKMIDKIIEDANVQDDFDQYANISEKEAVALLAQLDKNDSESILRQMEHEEESRQRVIKKKKEMREKLRVAIRTDMGLQMFHKQNTKQPDIMRYCKLLKAYAKEETEHQQLAETKAKESKANPVAEKSRVAEKKP